MIEVAFGRRGSDVGFDDWKSCMCFRHRDGVGSA